MSLPRGNFMGGGRAEQEPLFFTSRLISPEALKNERIYASIVGQMCEPPIMDLLNPETPETNVDRGFVKHYKSLLETSAVTLSVSKSVSSADAQRNYSEAGLLDYKETVGKISQSGIKYLPKNKDLAEILMHIDDYVELGNSNSFLGAYQAICDKSEGGQLHPHARFLINGVLVVAREVIARSANKGIVDAELGRWNRVGKTLLGDEANKLWENVKLKKDHNKGSLQFDGVLVDTTSRSFTVFGLPISEWKKGEIIPWTIFEMKGLPWSLINLKLINAANLTTGRAEVNKVREVDMKQLYDQLTSATDYMLGMFPKEPVNYPKSAIFVYARPFKQPRVFERMLDANFFLDYLEYLDNLKVVGRLLPEQLPPIERVSESLIAHLGKFGGLSDILDIRRRLAKKFDKETMNKRFPIPKLEIPTADAAANQVTVESWTALWDTTKVKKGKA